MLGVLFFMLIFLISWLALFINWIIILITKRKLNKAMKNRHPNIRRNLNFAESNLSAEQLMLGADLLFKVFLSFGSKERTKTYWNNFVDIKAIKDSNDSEIKQLLHRSIILTSNFPKIWIVMVGSILMIFLLWPNK